jgi:hypothetical protein
MIDVIKLANGTEVSWDEFSKWSTYKQNGSLSPTCIGLIHKKSTIKKITETKRRNIDSGETNIKKGGAHGRARCVVTPDGEFPTLKEAANYYNVKGEILRSWIKKNRTGFYYKKEIHFTVRPKGPISTNNDFCTSIITPAGVFPSIRQVLINFKISKIELDALLMHPNKTGFKINKSKKDLIRQLDANIRTPDGDFPTIKLAALHYGISINGMRYRIQSVYFKDFHYID